MHRTCEYKGQSIKLFFNRLKNNNKMEFDEIRFFFFKLIHVILCIYIIYR